MPTPPRFPPPPLDSALRQDDGLFTQPWARWFDQLWDRLRPAVYFFARQTGAAQSIASGVKTNVNLTGESDSDGAFAASAFTVPTAGVYSLQAAVSFAPTTTLTEAKAFIDLNGVTDLATGSQDGISQRRTILANAIATLSAGDVIRLKARQANAGALAQDIAGDPEATYLSGYRIG